MGPRASPDAGHGISALARQTIKVLVASGLLAGIIVIIQFTVRAESISEEKGRLDGFLTADVSTTITIVRALQGLLTTLVTVSLSQAFSYLQWSFIRSSHGDGTPYVRQLALSPTTSVSGTLSLIFHRSTPLGSRLWGFFRLFLMVVVGLAGIVLFFRTSLIVVFDTVHSDTVTAGVGPFNASYVAPFFESLKALEPGYPFNILPYSYTGQVHDLITNPFYTTTTDPIECQNNGQDSVAQCAAYLLSGGIVNMVPWIDEGFPEHSQIRIERAPAIHVEFTSLPAGKTFDAASCQLFGSNTTIIAAKFCLSQFSPTQLDAAIFVCTGGLLNGECVSTSPPPNITTRFSFHRRFATVLAAKSNLTITEASNLTSPLPISLSASEVVAYRSILAWLLDFSASNIPAPSSIIESFWSSHEQLKHSFSQGVILREFRSVLVFPLWIFNANNYGNPGLSDRVLSTSLPKEFYTTASVVRSYTKIKFEPTLVQVFAVFQGVAILFVWAVLVWAVSVRRSLPEISSFPIFDAEFKAEARGHQVPDAKGVWAYRDGDILDSMRHVKVERRVV